MLVLKSVQSTGGFKFLKRNMTLREIMGSIILSKACGPRSQAWLRFCLILREITKNINLPKVCGPRSQA